MTTVGGIHHQGQARLNVAIALPSHLHRKDRWSPQLSEPTHMVAVATLELGHKFIRNCL
jgi:hypothetical protein